MLTMKNLLGKNVLTVKKSNFFALAAVSCNIKLITRQ